MDRQTDLFLGSSRVLIVKIVKGLFFSIDQSLLDVFTKFKGRDSFNQNLRYRIKYMERQFKKFWTTSGGCPFSWKFGNSGNFLFYCSIPFCQMLSPSFLSRRHTWRFYTPIAANLIASENRKRFSPPIDADTLGEFFRRSRRCGTSTLFPGSIEERFEKSACDKIAQPD